MQAHTARMLRTKVAKKEQNSKKIIVVQGNWDPYIHTVADSFFITWSQLHNIQHQDF